MFDKTMERQRR